MRCFVVAGFLLTSDSRGPSAIAELLVPLCPVTRSAGRLLTAYGLVYRFYRWETSIFDPLPQNRRLLTDRHKFVTDDYVHDFYSCAKFGENPSMESFAQIGEI